MLNLCVAEVDLELLMLLLPPPESTTMYRSYSSGDQAELHPSPYLAVSLFVSTLIKTKDYLTYVLVLLAFNL